MAQYNSEKFYWLKLKRDFFKRHDIQVIEAMPNGKDYVLFYLKLMVESIDHNGFLRFSDTIPYNEQMLSVITNTNIDVVRSAIKVLQQLEMIEIQDDQTIYMTEVEVLIGSQSLSAEKKMQQRERRQKLLQGGQKVDKCPPEIEIEKEIDIDIKEKSIKEKLPLFTPPTVEEVAAYCKERGNNVDAEQFIAFYTSKGWMVGKSKMKDWKACVRTWERRDAKPRGNVENFLHRDYTDEEMAEMFKDHDNFDDMEI